ncbi:hypothetical protein Unana1_01832 [Umbelopsis nana]
MKFQSAPYCATQPLTDNHVLKAAGTPQYNSDGSILSGGDDLNAEGLTAGSNEEEKESAGPAKSKRQAKLEERAKKGQNVKYRR